MNYILLVLIITGSILNFLYARRKIKRLEKWTKDTIDFANYQLYTNDFEEKLRTSISECQKQITFLEEKTTPRKYDYGDVSKNLVIIERWFEYNEWWYKVYHKIHGTKLTRSESMLKEAIQADK